MVHTALPLGFMPWCLTCNAKQLQRLRESSMFTDRKYRSGYKTGSKKEWTASLRDIVQDVVLAFQKINAKNLLIYSTAALWHTDSLPESGQVQWSPELSKRNSSLRTIPPMCLAFFMGLDSLSNVRRKSLHKPIKLNNHDGFDIPIQILKKSKVRKSGNTLRRRSEFPARPNPLQDMGKSRFTTGNPINRATKHTENFWNNRVVLCTVSLPISNSIQCCYILSVSRTNRKSLLPQKDISYSRQCNVP